MNDLCFYGCGNIAKYTTIGGNPCCSVNYRKCPAVIRRIFETSSKSVHLKRQDNIDNYNKNPKLCLNCNQPIHYDKKINIFCSSVCSGSYNTRGRTLDKSVKEKISKSMSEGFKSGFLKPTNPRGSKCKRFSRISFRNCKICNKLFTVETWSPHSGKSTCSDVCQKLACFSSRTYQNGKRKTISYQNSSQGKVFLESSWELEIAELLDSLKIKWTRPKPIPWIDEDNKKRLYFPDFYLPKYHVYLDPKNPFCMDQDKVKMEYISKIVYIIYGELEIVKNYIISNCI